MSHLLAGVLSKGMLLSCEVALEYMLALTYSPQVQLMRSNHMTSATLLDEVEAELSKARAGAALSPLSPPCSAAALPVARRCVCHLCCHVIPQVSRNPA